MKIELLGHTNSFHAKLTKADGKGHRVTVQIPSDFEGDKAAYVESQITLQTKDPELGIDAFDMEGLKTLALECFDPEFTDRVEISETVEIVDDKAVLTTTRTTIEKPELKDTPLFNADGTAIMVDGKQLTRKL